MNVLESILRAQDGASVQRLGTQFGLGADQTTSAVSALVPAIAAGLRRNIGNDGGLDALMAALSGGGHSRYLEDPTSIAQADVMTDGNAILGHILGSKDVSRQVAARAATQTGIDSGILERMLPVVAAMAMGGLSSQANRRGSGMLPGQKTAGSGLLSMLTPLLDRDGDGSIVDDVLGALGRR